MQAATYPQLSIYQAVDGLIIDFFYYFILLDRCKGDKKLNCNNNADFCNMLYSISQRELFIIKLIFDPGVV